MLYSSNSIIALNEVNYEINNNEIRSRIKASIGRHNLSPKYSIHHIYQAKAAIKNVHIGEHTDDAQLKNIQDNLITMAKFLKSIFQSNDTRRTVSYEGSSEEDRAEPPMDGRRKLSISRSGRMKQAQKNRLSLSLEIYGAESQNFPTEKPKSVEYHVNPATPPVRDNSNQRRRSGDSRTSVDSGKVILRGQGSHVTVVSKEKRNTSPVTMSPDDEIDNAFEIIDKN